MSKSNKKWRLCRRYYTRAPCCSERNAGRLPAVRVKLDLGITALDKIAIIEEFYTWLGTTDLNAASVWALLDYKKHLFKLEQTKNTGQIPP